MLPSMPYLLTPMKIQPSSNNESDPLTDANPKPLGSCIKKEIIDNEVQDTIQKDNEDELNALMVASSTIQKNRKFGSVSEKKKAKQRKEYNATLALLSPEDPSVTEEKADRYAQAFYDKVQERLESESPEDYQKFMEVLSEHDESVHSVPELYEKIESVLSPKHPDLCEEFLTFLTPEQAKQIGKLVPHFMLSNMSLFLRKLEIYYSNQPAQLKKIYKGLTDLSNNPNVTMENVKSAILPLLKGSNLLVDWFLQMFPSEPPPESLMTDWEQVECNDIDNEDDDDRRNFETIVLPEVEDPYGGPNCVCKCHEIENEMYASRARHCIPCGTKFLQGRVYVQTGKGLRVANVTFNDSTDCDNNKRLNVKASVRQKRKIDTSPNKIMSPVKDDEPRHSNESEDDINLDSGNVKKQKSPKSSKTNRRIRKNNIKLPVNIKSDKKELSKNKKVLDRIQSFVKSQAKEGEEMKKISGCQSIEQVIVKEERPDIPCKIEIVEHDFNEYEMKSSPVESMDTCEESSQDTTDVQASDTDNDSTDDSTSSDNSDDADDNLAHNDKWTRDEDKIILQTFQTFGNNSSVFKDIHSSLSGRSLPEIKHRFQKLMNLLQQMTSI